MPRFTQTSFSDLGPSYSATATAVGTLNVKNYSTLWLDYSGLTAETFKVEASLDGVTFDTTGGMRPINTVTGVITTSSDLAAATVLSAMRVDVSGLEAVRFVKSAAVETLVLRTRLAS